MSKAYGKRMLAEIAMAQTRTEVESILVKCTTYKNAVPGTVRKWDRAARRRLAAIDKEGVKDAKADRP